ncbi:MAG: succinate dehydrogenase [Verrucomicrobia bacterium]|nr:succinate dehydrogenase [Verrucomicrobiota bacterium]
MTVKIDPIPKAFIWRRLHSLTGLWFVLFLIEHLITNSQAALLLGESGQGFVRAVNFIHNLPYLTVIEVGLLGVPILIHVLWGVKYALTSAPNSGHSDGSRPQMKYSRNRAYTWQRITAWLLIPLLAMHIVKFRFLDYPVEVNTGSVPSFMHVVSVDPGLYTVADRLNVQLFDEVMIKKMVHEHSSKGALLEAAREIREKDQQTFSQTDQTILQAAQHYEEQKATVQALAGMHLKPNQVVAVAPTFGTISLLGVRDTFKSPVWVAVYTLFVISACFHAFNGLWTSIVSWGWVIRAAAQTGARKVAYVLMAIIGLLGLIAVWGTYFFNLKY